MTTEKKKTKERKHTFQDGQPELSVVQAEDAHSVQRGRSEQPAGMVYDDVLASSGCSVSLRWRRHRRYRTAGKCRTEEQTFDMVVKRKGADGMEGANFEWTNADYDFKLTYDLIANSPD